MTALLDGLCKAFLMRLTARNVTFHTHLYLHELRAACQTLLFRTLHLMKGVLLICNAFL